VAAVNGVLAVRQEKSWRESASSGRMLVTFMWPKPNNLTVGGWTRPTHAQRRQIKKSTCSHYRARTHCVALRFLPSK
jgi:hypothetical protein